MRPARGSARALQATVALQDDSWPLILAPDSTCKGVKLGQILGIRARSWGEGAKKLAFPRAVGASVANFGIVNNSRYAGQKPAT